jgi:P-type E1-E2 ATPase
MLSGDSISATEAIAKELGIEQFYGDMSPEAKHTFIKELQAGGKKVLMVGDGMNDIPSLIEAKLSATLETSTNLTSNVSNVLIKKDDIVKILDLIYIGRKQNKIIKQNIIYTMILNIFLSINLVDYTSIVLTFLLSILIIVINSSRLRR